MRQLLLIAVCFSLFTGLSAGNEGHRLIRHAAWPSPSDWDPRSGEIFLGGGFNMTVFPLLRHVDSPVSGGIQAHAISDLGDRMLEFNLDMNFGPMNMTNIGFVFMRDKLRSRHRFLHGPGLHLSLMVYEGSVEIGEDGNPRRPHYFKKAPAVSYKFGWMYEGLPSAPILFSVEPVLPFCRVGAYYPLAITFSAQIVLPLND